MYVHICLSFHLQSYCVGIIFYTMCKALNLYISPLYIMYMSPWSTFIMTLCTTYVFIGFSLKTNIQILGLIVPAACQLQSSDSQ